MISQWIAILEHLKHNSIFILGLLLICGYAAGKLASKIKLPEITGFIVAGLLLGNSAIGAVSHTMGEDLRIITDMALGLIALTIGGEFYWVKLKTMGREVVIITLIQIVSAFLFTTLGLVLFKMPLPYAMILGAISTATAPAATVAIVSALNAQGKFVDYLYGIVALDDAGAVVLFGVVFAFVSSFMGSVQEASSVIPIIGAAFLEVIFSLSVGALYGYILHLLVVRKHNKNEITILSVAILFLSISTAMVFHLSPLLTNMAAGAILINLSARHHRIFHILEPLTPPIYALFFIIAGIELNPAALLENVGVLILGLVYVILRAIGKVGGVYLGARIVSAPEGIRKYLGYSMLPQAGVAIGLVLMIQTSPFGQALIEAGNPIMDDLFNIVLFSVFINELLGPPAAKYALIKGLELEE